MSKKSIIFNRCVGIVTVTWTIEKGSVKETYRTRFAMMIEGLTKELKAKFIKEVKDVVKESVLADKAGLGISDDAVLRFYAGFHALECEYFCLPKEQNNQPSTKR